MSVKTPSKLEKILSEGHLAVTSECGPPRGSNPAPIIEKAEMIKDHVDAINITDNQTSMTRMSSLAACIRLKLMGVEPVLQMVTRDRNRIALQSDILGAASFDINNILCLSGDHQSFGDNPKGQNVHDIDSMQLIQTVRLMRDEAKFLGGLGPCGRPLCCTKWLNKPKHITVKMVKEQGFQISPTRTSGMCGRLMCCFEYEQEARKGGKK